MNVYNVGGKGMALESVTFLASLPAIQSAIKIGSDTMRVQLEIPASEKAKALPLMMWENQVLEVTVKPVVFNMADHNYGKAPVGKGTKRKSEWTAAQEPSVNNNTGEDGR